MFKRQFPVCGLDLLGRRGLLYLEYFVRVDVVWHVIL